MKNYQEIKAWKFCVAKNIFKKEFINKLKSFQHKIHKRWHRLIKSLKIKVKTFSSWKPKLLEVRIMKFMYRNKYLHNFKCPFS